ncbi:class I SAM-dependent methyltransferase [Mycobacterium sp. 1423905.2]|uniref:class I SAM-dependent methyltransferase n=1 Tax=Mycobacterium sp. 1423905.2 TaxID=1856859 RepID=UPI0008014F04|nr:class I SAM-dependent methyltransferase [Mycobacterium sp. 1423905.2]OBJ50904.1 SAM-dependent methyltransferase [Mycobacterium sp. 1423905.2]
MVEPRMDWDSAYRLGVPPPWSIGRPQPELAAIFGQVRSDVLDAGCGHAALSLELATLGHTVVGLDISATAVSAAAAAAAERRFTTATFAQADMTDLHGYDGRFNTVIDSGLLHSLPIELCEPYLRGIHRAAAPGASLFVLAFAPRPAGEHGPGPRGFTAEELRATVAKLWRVDEVRAATIYAHDGQPDGTGHLTMAGHLLTAHK